MIFDLIAANGGKRKYLFKDGVVSDIIGGIWNAYDGTNEMVIDGNGITFTITGAATTIQAAGSYSYTNMGFMFSNKVKAPTVNKICFEFEYFNAPQMASKKPSYAEGFYVSANESISSITGSYDLFVPVERRNDPFIVEVDISSTKARKVAFYAGVFAEKKEDIIGKGLRIKSIWYT